MTSNTRKVDNNRLSEYPVHTVRGWTTPSSKTHLPTPGSAAMNSKMSSVAKRTLVQNTGSTDSTRLVEGMEVSSTSGSAVSSQSKASSSESDVGLLMVEGESRLVGGPGVATIDSNEDGRISESPELTIKNLGGFNSPRSTNLTSSGIGKPNSGSGSRSVDQRTSSIAVGVLGGEGDVAKSSGDSEQSSSSSSESDVGLLMVEGESRLVGGPRVATIDSNEDGRISESPEFTIKNLGGFNSFVTPDAVVVTRGCNGVGDRACELVPPKQKKIPEDGTVVTL